MNWGMFFTIIAQVSIGFVLVFVGAAAVSGVIKSIRKDK